MPDIRTAIQAIDRAVLAMLAERNQLSEQLETSSNSGVFIPDCFVSPSKTGLKVPLGPSVNIAPNTKIAFEPSDAYEVFITQHQKSDITLTPPDHNFEIEINILNNGGSHFLSFEYDLGPVASDAITNVGAVVKVSVPWGEAHLSFIVSGPDMEDIVLAIGSVAAANGKYRSIANSIIFDPSEHADLSEHNKARLALFVPHENNASATITQFTAFVS